MKGVDGKVGGSCLCVAQQQEQAAHGWLQSRWHWQEDGSDATVRRFLAYDAVNEINPFEIRGDERLERRAFALRLRDAADLFKLGTLWRRQMMQLSNGEIRRVLLARALLKQPRLLVLDDPFAGLDSEMRERLKTALNRLACDRIAMVLMVRHEDEIPACATHRLTLSACRIIGTKKNEGRGPAVCRSGDVTPTLHALPALLRDRRCPNVCRLTPVVELRNVTVRYGQRTVLNRLDWIVRAGEKWVVVGPNGAGKTTLLSLITGDNPAAYANDVRVFGRPRVGGESLWLVRRRIGQVSPEIQCYFDAAMPCLAAVMSGRYNDQGEAMRPTHSVREKAREWLRLFGLEEAARLPFGSLSAGRQRLVLLARALLPEPELLVLDEPCLNLDAASRHLVLGMLDRLLITCRTETMICVAHRADDVPRGFTQVLHL